MPSPVRELMQSSSVVARSVLERLLSGKVDAVASAIVEGSVTLVVRNPCARVRQNALAALDDFKNGLFRSRIGWDPIDLFGIEHRVDTMNQAPVGLVLGRFTVVRLGRFPARGVLRFPILDVGAAFPLSDLPALCCGLSIRHPPRILVSAAERGSHQINGVTASVRFFGGWVEWHRRTLPR